ncbi:hypothetical protein [Cytobacillus depressus]|uniref:hypothetical protein n=1 Tax=Cytobacillus depressus TaxID=1602942 RepID=UPI001478BB4D|nr:hypothetical protein [Cytobacillus depressus]
MPKNKEADHKKQTNAEFGMEFGDINASKLFEIPFMNKEKYKEKNHKCKEESSR